MRILMIAVVLMFPLFAGAQDGWRLDTSSAPWQVRNSHTATTFNGGIWLMNGRSGLGLPHPTDIWSTSDGVAWTEEVEIGDLPWTAKSWATTTAMNNRLWVMGGWSAGQGHHNDVWSSPDGITWTEETSAAPWPARSGLASVEFNGRLWVLGGQIRQGQNLVRGNDVWSSADGVNWAYESTAAWSGREGLQAVVFDSRIWVVGGYDGNLTRDVWSSADGILWNLETVAASWPARFGQIAAVYNGRLWVIGGMDEFQNRYNDAWSSPDGINWTQETPDAPWLGRALHAIAVFNGRLWILGGSGGAQIGYMNDVWSYGLHASPDDLPDGVVGHPYSASLEAREGDGPFVWALVGGSLPPGLVLDTATTAATLPITGSPSQVGAFQFTIHLTDDNGYTNEQQITIQVNPPKPLQTESSSSTGCALRHVPIPAWLLLPAAIAWFRKRRRLQTT